ncbi:MULTISPECIES: hypothetical protein [Pseudoalteromonas]|jgi:hypothetical protein|uniref:hypothetical protein n=1 Tax=Pseudoalteromonas TaxID=53246 RepID=UPI00029A81AB|nr:MULTISPECIES: hypothetical protein [Pseudoalteromonas]AUJ68615.1 hypothetical protein PNC201_01350 [Pseudoalteromonas sp. NC201]MBR8842944.1 hypothetical protein [Pseudoalteromonas sp. JC3]MCF2828826.1 hypothetical protein [Pseudoalteromonas sp. OF5H-5]MCF2831103.1 hypothetical protein [Pseudoalteromonas sp. DL2-H6]MCF2925746.1 hypothetical protein [Pseudoalteromonas sp. DL2-H1]
MAPLKAVKIIALALLMQACNSAPASTSVNEAVLSASTPEVLSQLKQAIVKLKGGVPPTLASTVFQRSPTLLLEHGQSLDGNGSPILGAHNLAYESFILQLRDTQCVLYYPKKDTYVVLSKVSCKKLEK